MGATTFDSDEASERQLRAAVVYVVDDDPDFCQLTAALLRRAGYETVAFTSASEFLERLPSDELLPRCLVTDLSMPDIDGLQLQEMLAARDTRMPSIFLSGRGGIPSVVEALKLGAVDFLEKPVNHEVLRASVALAIQRDTESCEQEIKRRAFLRRLGQLTPREREVFELLVLGKGTKEIAAALKISIKTVFVHRARVLDKMKVDNLVALSRLADGTLAEEGTTGFDVSVIGSA